MIKSARELLLIRMSYHHSDFTSWLTLYTSQLWPHRWKTTVLLIHSNSSIFLKSVAVSCGLTASCQCRSTIKSLAIECQTEQHSGRSRRKYPSDTVCVSLCRFGWCGLQPASPFNVEDPPKAQQQDRSNCGVHYGVHIRHAAGVWASCTTGQVG